MSRNCPEDLNTLTSCSVSPLQNINITAKFLCIQTKFSVEDAMNNIAENNRVIKRDRYLNKVIKFFSNLGFNFIYYHYELYKP